MSTLFITLFWDFYISKILHLYFFTIHSLSNKLQKSGRMLDVANMLQIKVDVRKIYLILVTFQKVQGMNSIIMKI